MDRRNFLKVGLAATGAALLPSFASANDVGLGQPQADWIKVRLPSYHGHLWNRTLVKQDRFFSHYFTVIEWRAPDGKYYDGSVGLFDVTRLDELKNAYVEKFNGKLPAFNYEIWSDGMVGLFSWEYEAKRSGISLKHFSHYPMKMFVPSSQNGLFRETYRFCLFKEHNPDNPSSLPKNVFDNLSQQDYKLGKCRKGYHSEAAAMNDLILAKSKL